MSLWNRVSVVTPPASPIPSLISLADLRAFLAISDAENDANLTRAAKGAVAMIDGREGIGYAVLTQTWRLTLDCFPPVIILPGAPIKSVTSITYVDGDGYSQTLNLADCRIELGIEPATIIPAYGLYWPTTLAITGAIKIDYVLGEETGATVNARLMDCICLIVGMRDKFTEAVGSADLRALPFGVQAMLDDFRRLSVAA
jgi:uncharacterized phiE125 gp8 family phage protein